MKIKMRERYRPQSFWTRAAQTIKKLFTNAASLRVILFVLSGALACAAGFYAYSLWNEGVTAQQNAADILRVSGFANLEAYDGETDGLYQQPEGPQAGPDALDGLFDSALKGYSVVARLDIPSIGVSLPVLSETTDTALKYSVCYFSGPEPGGEGNLIITGHNYASGAHFGNLDEMKAGDTANLTDPNGNVFTYTVYETELITPDDTGALSDMQYGRELTLLTCEENANRRLLVRFHIADGE